MSEDLEEFENCSKKKKEYEWLPKGEDLFTYSSNAVKLLEKYSNIFTYHGDEYVNKFLVSNHWEKKVPREWRPPLLAMSTKELIFMARDQALPKDKKFKFPDSLRKFVSDCKKYRIRKLKNEDLEKPLELKTALKTNIKKKKLHEIERLCVVVHDLIKRNKIDTVLDLGCGSGYLTQAISSLFPDVEIIGIDNSPDQLKSFKKRKEKIQMRIEKIEKKKENKTFGNVKVVIKDLTLENLKQLEAFIEKKKNAMIIGLHCCGDLTPYCIRVFANSKKIRTLVNVSCCYFKLTDYGFPMSKDLGKQMKNLTPDNLAIGCFATSTWTVGNSNKQFSIRSMRFVLENMLFECNLRKGLKIGANLRNFPKSIKKFPDYVKWAFKKIIEKYEKVEKFDRKCFDDFLKQESFEKKMIEYYAKFEPDQNGILKRVECFWCLRGLVSNVVESLVVLDRLLFLNSIKNSKTVIRRIFKGEVSPRNIVLQSEKF